MSEHDWNGVIKKEAENQRNATVGASELTGIVMLPCPFCGAAPVVGNGFSPAESTYYAWCSNGDCELSPLGRDERLFDIDWWNTRAT